MKQHKLKFFPCLLFFLLTYTGYTQAPGFSKKVNVFIGTGGHGHTYPGASMPFGMMQLSPDTRLEGWDGCSGYHYSDSMIYGFSHTHLSGTGVADYCDILLMPFTGVVKWKNAEYASAFSHKNEKASPGFYEVLLDKHHIKASLTTATRSGMHQYQFPATAKEGKVLIDLQHRDEVLESSLEIVNDHEIKGMRRSKSWAGNQVIYFYLVFEKPIRSSAMALNDEPGNELRSASGKNVKACFIFDLSGDKNVQVKIGISGVSMQNAKENLEAEIPGWNFTKIKWEAAAAWDRELGKIEVKGGTADEQTVFYTALYHASLNPNTYTDVNGDFRGTDGKIHKAEGFTNYSVFSLWDTYRALHPLMTITNRKRTADWINTFLAQYKYGGMMPVWELAGNETFCMIGYHSVSVIADAYQKGIRGFDTKLALEAMTDYAESDRFGLKYYRQNGFVSNDVEHESASKTMEYAYDDWCIAQFAKATGNEGVYQKYNARAHQYKNLFDPAAGHIRGKVQAFWYSPFNATEVNNFFTEGNSWHYSFAAPQDIKGMIKLYGGKEKFATKLNELFTTEQKLSGREQSDVTGLLGQYAHGNEPSHHMAYLFDYAAQPWRTQELIHTICKDFYKNDPDGLIGNEDCGQMSAWYVLSAMGFYPVTPGSTEYALGTPLFDEVKIHQENGKTFSIKTKNRSAENFYLQSTSWNGKDYKPGFITNEMIESGGTFLFYLGSKPNYKRAVNENEAPFSTLAEDGFVPVPYFEVNTNKVKDKLPLIIKHIDTSARIFYRMRNETEFIPYRQPFMLYKAAVIELYAEKNGLKSPVISQQFHKVVTDRTIEIKSEVHPMYSAGGKDALIDGIVGTANWKTGEWQSYFAKDFEAVIDFKSSRLFNYVAIHVLQDVSPWILYPKEVQFEISDDGIQYLPLVTVTNKINSEQKETQVQELGTNINATGRYIRIKAISGGVLPAWHESAGQPSHLFIDEVIIK